ncbi:MAG TPA: addiction module protein [Geobacteraceae bacterium]
MKTAVKRATVYLDDDLHRALRLKAAATSRSISDLVNDAVKESLAEDKADLAAYRDRVNEPAVSFEALTKLTNRDKIQAMESLWEDLCRHAGKLRSPAWHGTLLEQREENICAGEAEFIDWDLAKKRIREECQ